MSGELTARVNEAARGLVGAAAKAVKKKVRAELVSLIRGCWTLAATRQRRMR